MGRLAKEDRPANKDGRPKRPKHGYCGRGRYNLRMVRNAELGGTDDLAGEGVPLLWVYLHVKQGRVVRELALWRGG